MSLLVEVPKRVAFPVDLSRMYVLFTGGDVVPVLLISPYAYELLISIPLLILDGLCIIYTRYVPVDPGIRSISLYVSLITVLARVVPDPLAYPMTPPPFVVALLYAPLMVVFSV